MPRLLSAAFVLVVASWANGRPPAVASAVAYHPKGNLVAFGTHGEVRLFDAMSGEPIRKITGQTGRVTALAFSPDGSVLAVASGEPSKAGMVRLHALNDPATGTITITHPDVIYALA